MPLNTYLHASGNAEEMLEFYQSALGGTLEIRRYKDAPPEAREAPDDWDDKVMHGWLKAPNDTSLFVMDAPPGRQPERNGDNFTLAYLAASDDAARDAFEKLSAGAQIYVPLGPSFFSSLFGMLNDTYGIRWMVMVQRA